MEFVIGLDLGTTACKAVALDSSGRITASASANYPLYAPQSGWAEQDPQEILGDHVQGIGHGQPQDALPLLHRYEMMLEHQVDGQGLEQGEIHRLAGEIQGGVEVPRRPDAQGLLGGGDGIRRNRGV